MPFSSPTRHLTRTKILWDLLSIRLRDRPLPHNPLRLRSQASRASQSWYGFGFGAPSWRTEQEVEVDHKDGECPILVGLAFGAPAGRPTRR